MRRQFLFTLLAICAALLSGLVVFSSTHRDSVVAQATDEGAIKILVAARDLPGGAELAPDSYRLTVWPRERVPAGAIVEPAQLLNQVTKFGLLKNQPITAGGIISRDAKRNPAEAIPPGLRAIAAPVEQLEDGAALVRPHARADVLVSVGAGAEQAFSRIVLQNVEILAAASSVNAGGLRATNTQVVTLLVSPADAERLVLASHEGALSLAIRNDADHEVVRTSGMTIADLVRGATGLAASWPRGKGAERSPSQAATVEVMRNGRSIENLAFDRDHEIRTVVSADEAPAASADGAAPQSGAPAASAVVGKVSVPEVLQGATQLARSVRRAGGVAPVGAGYDSPNAKTVEIP